MAKTYKKGQRALFDENEELTKEGLELSKKLGTHFHNLFDRYKDCRTKDVFVIAVQAAEFARCMRSLMNACKRMEARKK